MTAYGVMSGTDADGKIHWVRWSLADPAEPDHVHFESDEKIEPLTPGTHRIATVAAWKTGLPTPDWSVHDSYQVYFGYGDKPTWAIQIENQ